MKKNITLVLLALAVGLLGSAAVNAQEVSCSGSGGVNCSGTIPDFPIATPFTSTINLSQNLTCSGGPYVGMGVRVNLTHDHVGDLNISVTGPSGTTTLLNQPAGSGAAGACAGEDIQAVFGSLGIAANSCQEVTIPAISGNILATGPGTAFLQSGNTTGAWQLTVTDLSNGFEGFVQDWALVPQCGAPTAIPTQSSMGLLATILLVFGLGLWNLASTRRRN